MQPTMYLVSVPVMIKALENLKHIVEKGADHVKVAGLPESALLGAKLAPDMFDFTRQVQIASDNAKGICARLSGGEPPKMEDNEKTFAELVARIEKTVAFLKTLKPESFEGGAERKIPFPYIEGKYMLGDEAFFQSYLPNFFFHVTVAYAILRNQGVELGKADFIGDLPLKDMA